MSAMRRAIVFAVSSVVSLTPAGAQDLFLSRQKEALGVIHETARGFAKLLGTELQKWGMTFTTHHAENICGERRQIVDNERGVYRYDQLMVLKNTKAPAVLLEAGVIVNREEESALSSPERQKLISESALSVAIRFCGETQQAQRRDKQ